MQGSHLNDATCNVLKLYGSLGSCCLLAVPPASENCETEVPSIDDVVAYAGKVGTKRATITQKSWMWMQNSDPRLATLSNDSHELKSVDLIQCISYVKLKAGDTWRTSYPNRYFTSGRPTELPKGLMPRVPP